MTLLHVLPVTRPGVQAVDDAVWRFAGTVRNDPTTWEVRAVEFTAVMALSRVYLRAHRLTDTVADALLGAGLALGWPALLMALRSRRDAAARQP